LPYYTYLYKKIIPWFRLKDYYPKVEYKENKGEVDSDCFGVFAIAIPGSQKQNRHSTLIIRLKSIHGLEFFQIPKIYFTGIFLKNGVAQCKYTSTESWQDFFLLDSKS
jgi:hypothetical protein